MRLSVGTILRVGVIWGIVAVLLAILATFLGGVLPAVEGLSLGTYALLMAGVHYPIRHSSDVLYSLVGGALSGFLAGVFLVLLQLFGGYLPITMPPGAPSDIVGALVAGVIAGIAGALSYKLMQRV